MFAEQLDDHLGQLAHHYSRSDNVSKAVEYLGRAGSKRCSALRMLMRSVVSLRR